MLASQSMIFFFFGIFRIERSMQTRAISGRLPVAKPAAVASESVAKATTSTVAGGQKAGNEEFNKEKAEQDLRLQRAALNQKRAIEMQKNRGGECTNKRTVAHHAQSLAISFVSPSKKAPAPRNGGAIVRPSQGIFHLQFRLGYSLVIPPPISLHLHDSLFPKPNEIINIQIQSFSPNRNAQSTDSDAQNHCEKSRRHNQSDPETGSAKGAGHSSPRRHNSISRIETRPTIDSNARRKVAHSDDTCQSTWRQHEHEWNRSKCSETWSS